MSERKWAVVRVEDRQGQRPRGWPVAALRCGSKAEVRRSLDMLREAGSTGLEIVEVELREGDWPMWIQVGTEPDATPDLTVRTVDDGVLLGGYLLTFTQAEALARALDDASRSGSAAAAQRQRVEAEQERRRAFRAQCVATDDVGLGIVGIDAHGRPLHYGPGWPGEAEWAALDKLGADIKRPVAWQRGESGKLWHRKGCGWKLDWWRLSLWRYMPDGEVPEGGTACAATRRKWGVR